jgi:hypothetical protein
MLVGRVRPNPDTSPRQPDETTNEHLLRTGLLYDLVPVAAGLPFVYAFAEWFTLRPNVYSPVRLLVDGRPVRLATGRPPRLLPRVLPDPGCSRKFR